MNTKTLGFLLGQKQKEKLLSFRGLANALGMQSVGTVHQWVKGSLFPSQENIHNVAKFLEMTEREVEEMVGKETGRLPRKSPSNNRLSTCNDDSFCLDATDLDHAKPMVEAYGKPMPISLFRQIVESQRSANAR